MAWIIVGIVILAVLLWAVAAYNSLIRLRNKADEADAGIDAELKKRYDLVPNLVETVKGYASHEKETLDSVIRARNSAVNAGGRAARDEADKGLTGALSRLFALAENYPDLKANQSFVQLQNELSAIETSILNARKYYNAIAREFNDRIMVFPSSIIASLFHFTKRDYVAVEEESKANVRVSF